MRLHEKQLPTLHKVATIPEGMPRVSILVTGRGETPPLQETVKSLQSQDYDRVEFRVVLGDSANLPTALSDTFNLMGGDIQLWLNEGERLCPWACRLVAAIMSKMPEVDWLTSSTPVAWTRSGMLVETGYSGGFTRKTFLQGRNLKGSSNYSYPIERASTFWTRALWRTCGSEIRAALEAAGDFELWARFWEVSNLTCISVPLGGRISGLDGMPDEQAYWESARQILSSHSGGNPPSRYGLRLRKFLVRRIPSLAPRLAERAQHVWLNAEDESVTVTWKPYV